jgi:hypothetical protein
MVTFSLAQVSVSKLSSDFLGRDLHDACCIFLRKTSPRKTRGCVDSANPRPHTNTH